MTDRYINPATGINTGAGTLAAPWKDLEYALEGNRCTEGDTIYLMAGDYSNIFVDKVTANQSITLALTANSGAETIIRPYSGADIQIQIPSNANNVNTAWVFYSADYNIKWIGVHFINQLNYITRFWQQISNTANAQTIFEDCLIEKGTSTTWFSYQEQGGSGTDVRNNSVIYERCVCKNVPGEIAIALRFQTPRDNFITDFRACDIELSGTSPFVTQYYNNRTKVRNCNFKFLSTVGAIVSCYQSTGMDLLFANNRINRAAASRTANSALRTSVVAEAYYTANPSKWVVKNNVCWDDYCQANMPLDGAFFWMSTAGGYLQDMVVDRSNIAIPLTDNASYGCGDSAYMPEKALLLDGNGKPIIGGGEWLTSNDVGCYKNPVGVTAKYTNKNTLIFFGDSISDINNHVQCDWWNANAKNDITAIVYNNDNPGADPGIGYQQLMTYIDWNCWRFRPEWGVICIGVNNLSASGVRFPTNLTNQRMAEQIIELLKRLIFWGVKPIWLGIPSLAGDVGGITDPQAVNAIIEPVCKSNGWAYGNVINYMISKNASWQTVYYDAYATDVHPNTLGMQVMAEYALQLVNEARSAGANYGIAKRPMVSTGFSKHFR